MRHILQTLFSFSYIVVGLISLFAIMGQLSAWFGWHWLIALLVALLLTYIPLVGSILGYFGMVNIWGWSPIAALLVVILPYVLGIAAGITGYIGQKINKHIH